MAPESPSIVTTTNDEGLITNQSVTGRNPSVIPASYGTDGQLLDIGSLSTKFVNRNRNWPLAVPRRCEVRRVG